MESSNSAERNDSPSSGAEVFEMRMPARGTKWGRNNAKVLEKELGRKKEPKATRIVKFKEL